ncbi:hypothetical protein Tco_0726968 [Tanacetum coccineum]|uniref:Uncharacterized protein n=1 Tax=Tanacetum coccineum TaxID=301880 RepID=A0ABQ4YI11_9ASTR
MEYLVKISKKACILKLKQRNLKITVLTSYTPYPSRNIRCIYACTPPKTTREQGSIRRLRKKYCLSLKNDMPPRDKMDNPNITMEEYIRLEEEKAHRHGKVYNWETAKYDSSTEPVEIHHRIDEFDLKDETSLSKYDEEEQNGVFISRAWRRLFEIRGLLEFFSTFKFGEVVVDLDMAGALQFQLGGGPDDEICHRLIACSIVGRSQAPKKLDDMWSWVAPGPERQPNVAAGAFEAAKDAPAVDEGALADPTPMQVPQPPHAAPRTMPQRIMRLEEDVYEL